MENKKIIKDLFEFQNILNDDQKNSEELKKDLFKMQKTKIFIISPMFIFFLIIGIYFIIKDNMLLTFLSFSLIQLISIVDKLNNNINLKYLTKKYLTNVKVKMPLDYIYNIIIIIIFFILLQPFK